MKKSKELYMYILGGLIVIAFFIIIYVLITKEIPALNEQLLLILLGVLAAKFSDVVSYFFGSSKGSADKSEYLEKTNGNGKS